MRKALFIFFISLFACTARSQDCGIENTAFASGERLTYNLYFNWKFVWFKVGQATMNTDLTTFDGKKAWRASLVTGGNKRLDKFFTMRDTLLSYCDTDLSPLYFRKGAREGKRYYIDELWYTYPQNTCKLRMHRVDADGEVHWKDARYKDCIYDMMSIFLRARNFDSSTMKEGDRIPMPISDASRLSHSWLQFRGRETFKVDDTKEKFRCLVFSFIEREKGENRELIRFFVTDDQNHIPVRLDLNLNFGSAKAFLKDYKGVRNEMTSKIK
ncbi:MAG: DUF3108 domain-containing protein [Prevotella sp.]|nr:DUF3108 domain-containing protein [Prevotella sp.]